MKSRKPICFDSKNIVLVCFLFFLIDEFSVTQLGSSWDWLQCPPSVIIQKSCSLWTGKAAVRMLQTGCAPCESFPIAMHISQVGPRGTVRKIYPIFTYIIPFFHPSIQSMLRRTMIIPEQSKKQFGTNTFCRSIYNLCEPHITDSVRRQGTTFKKQIVL